jgi:hypothetical protein
MLSAVIAFSGFSGPRLGLRPTEPQRAPLSRVRCQAEIYRLKLRTPLGIGFEERTPGEPDGVEVAFLVEGGNAEQDGRICVGDYLLRCSAVILGGEASLVTIGGGSQFTSWERELIPTSKMDFETIMTAIGTNSGRFGYTDVALELQRTPKSVNAPRPAARGVERLLADDSVDGEWNLGGMNVDGKSTPIRARPDKF